MGFLLALKFPGITGQITPPPDVPTGGLFPPFATGQDAIRAGLSFFLIIVLLLAILYATLGAMRYIFSRGDKEKIKGAREKITYSIVGLIVAFLAFLLVGLFSSFVNVPFISKIALVPPPTGAPTPTTIPKCPAPTMLSCETLSDTVIRGDWTQNLPFSVNYQLEACPPVGACIKADGLTVGGTDFVKNLTPGTTYNLHVRVENNTPSCISPSDWSGGLPCTTTGVTPTPTPTPIPCSDNDPLDLITFAGTCTDFSGSFADSCLSGTDLRQFKCSANLCVASSLLTCAISCVGGACIIFPTPTGTPVPTATPIPTSTPIPTPIPTLGPTATPIPTSTPIPTPTPIAIATINGRVWKDLNGDGGNAGELGFAGATVKALFPDNSLASTTSSDSTGNFEFLTLSANIYKIVLEVPNRFKMSSASNGGSNEVSGVGIPPPKNVFNSFGAFGIVPIVTGTVLINGGAEETTSSVVTLTLTCSVVTPFSCAQVRIANTFAGLDSAAVESFIPSRDWPLDWPLPPSSGFKVVYVQFRVAGGTWSSQFVDTIDLVL